MSLHTRIFIAMGIGLIVGFALNLFVDPASTLFTNCVWWLDLLGKDLFIGALKMIIAPLILASIVAGISSLPHASELGNIGGKTLLYYVTTTTIAVAIGIVAVLVIRPGERAASQQVRAERESELALLGSAFQQETGLDPQAAENRFNFRMYVAQAEGQDIEGGAMGAAWQRMRETEEQGIADMLRRQILAPILMNPFTALSANPPNALGIIFFAILVGLACLVIGAPAAPIVSVFRAANEVMMKITMWFMEASPIAIGCLLASLVATLGLDALASLAWYCATVIIGIAIHVCVLLSIVRWMGKMSVRKFAEGISEAWIIAFSTTSSAATLPVTLHCVTEKLEVDEKVAEFSLPVGATVNMDGTALYEGVAVIFLIQLFGGLVDAPIELTFGSTLVIFITAVLASIGAAAVPSAGLVTMAIVASAVGLPLHYIPIIYAVDRFLDMFRTSTNVLGDAVGAVVVNRLEKIRLG